MALDRYYNLSGALCNISIEFYEGDKPAVPSDPMNVVLQDYTLFASCFCLSGYIGNWDINGKYINPDKIEVAVLEDGDYLTLSADDGYNIDEDIVWMPWSFSDNTGEPVADAIAAVSTRQQAKRIFNLYGQRLNKTQRGLNVIDGKALIAK